jgi:hypothetical protein
LGEYNFQFALVAPHPDGDAPADPYAQWLLQAYGNANDRVQQRRRRGILIDVQYERLTTEVVRKVIDWRRIQGQPYPGDAEAIGRTEYCGTRSSVQLQSPTEANALIESLSHGSNTALAALGAENWRLLPDVLGLMNRTMSDLCAKTVGFLDHDVHRRVIILGDKHIAAIEAMGAPSMDALARVLHHADPYARAGACYALQLLGLAHTVSREILEELGRLVTAGTKTDREASVCALSAIARKQDLLSLQNVLALLLADKDPSIRWTAARMISDSEMNVTDRTCVEALASLLADKTKDVLEAGRDVFGGSFEPPAPDIPTFLYEVAQGKQHTATPKPTPNTVAVRLGNGGISGVVSGDDLRTLASGGSVFTKVVDLRSEEERTREEEASAGSSLGTESDVLVKELIVIGGSDEFLSNDPGGKFDERRRHIRAREIGERLNELGGKKLMEAAYYRVRNALGGGPARLLESAWGYIGSWMP